MLSFFCTAIALCLATLGAYAGFAVLGFVGHTETVFQEIFVALVALLSVVCWLGVGVLAALAVIAERLKANWQTATAPPAPASSSHLPPDAQSCSPLPVP